MHWPPALDPFAYSAIHFVELYPYIQPKAWK